MAVNTYYFDASDAAISDPNSVWTNDANAFDGSLSTFATASSSGSEVLNYLLGEGTNAPTSIGAVTLVRARVYGDDGGSSPGYGTYVTLSAPSTGWTPQTIKNLEIRIWRQSVAGSNNIQVPIRTNGWGEALGQPAWAGVNGQPSVDVYKVEIEVTYNEVRPRTIRPRIFAPGLAR